MKYYFILLFISLTVIVSAIYLENDAQKKSYGKLSLSKPQAEIPRVFKYEITLSNARQADSVPEVELNLSEDRDFFSWDSRVRYSISISDKKDGQSRYGEINGNEVLLEVEYLPVTNKEVIKEKMELPETEPEHRGLTLMKRSTCFNCHADKSKLAGPSFAEISKKYKKTFSNIKSLAGSITDGSSEVWGSSTMPAYPDFSVMETEQIADYILRQGGMKNKWILPGLDGTFYIIKNPDSSANGVYVLTASYTSSLDVIGRYSMILPIK